MLSRLPINYSCSLPRVASLKRGAGPYIIPDKLAPSENLYFISILLSLPFPRDNTEYMGTPKGGRRFDSPNSLLELGHAGYIAPPPPFPKCSNPEALHQSQTENMSGRHADNNASRQLPFGCAGGKKERTECLWPPPPPHPTPPCELYKFWYKEKNKTMRDNMRIWHNREILTDGRTDLLADEQEVHKLLRSARQLIIKQ